MQQPSDPIQPPLGPTTTIARFVGEASEIAPDGDVKTARVRGRVTFVEGRDGDGHFTVDDGTGELTMVAHHLERPAEGSLVETDVKRTPDGVVHAVVLRRSPDWN